MEMDMRVFDCEMRLDDLEEYMFAEPSDDISFYDGEQHEGGGPWHGTAQERSLYSACSPSLSRSSSHVSLLSDSDHSFDNFRQGGFIYHGQALHGLCSPLSRMTRSNSSSLQSFESDEIDDPNGPAKCDTVVRSDASVTSDEHLNADLSSLMASMLGSGAHVDGQNGDWNPAPGHQHSPGPPPRRPPPHPLQIAGKIAEPISSSTPSFGNSPGCLGQLCESGGNRQVGQYSIPGLDEIESLLSSRGTRNLSQPDHEERAQPLTRIKTSSDLFYHHLSLEDSFQKCHIAHSSGFQPYAVPQLGIRCAEDLNGIRLIHLLLAGAEAVASLNVDLATVILVRLKELVSRTGNTMQRVAAYFCEGLQYRIEGVRGSEKAIEPQNDSLSAFQVLHEVSPYIKFGHFTANQAILEAFEGERRVHIIDYDILEGIQWPSLMQALACRKGGPPHLRITALCRPHVKRSLAMTQETGKRLTEFAASFNIPFSFHQVRIDNEDEFRPSLLKQVKGECLAVNCMLHLPHMPHRSKSAFSTFLRAVHKLSPKVVSLVEEELSCSTPTFVSHFFEALQHYSAIFDSLEASLSAESKGRMLVERIFLSPRIASLITSSNSEQPCILGGNLHWHSLAQVAGFVAVPMSVYNICQARLLLGLFSDGYKVEEDHNRLLLAWRSKVLLSASVWSSSKSS